MAAPALAVTFVLSARRETARVTSSPRLSGVLSDDQLEMLRAIPPGRGGSSEEEIERQFPDRMHLLRQLAAEGYVEMATMPIRDAGQASTGLRIYHVTQKGAEALRDPPA